MQITFFCCHCHTTPHTISRTMECYAVVTLLYEKCSIFKGTLIRVSLCVYYDLYGLSPQGKYHCMADLLFSWFGFDQTRKTVVKCNVSKAAQSKQSKQQVSRSVKLHPMASVLWLKSFHSLKCCCCCEQKKFAALGPDYCR